MSTCSQKSTKIASSVQKKNSLHLPVVSEGQTGWKQWGNKWQRTLPCRYTLHAWRNGSTAVTEAFRAFEASQDLNSIQPVVHCYALLFMLIRHARNWCCDLAKTRAAFFEAPVSASASGSLAHLIFYPVTSAGPGPWSVTSMKKTLQCGYSNVINHPFLMVYTCLYHPFVMIWGMVHYCYTTWWGIHGCSKRK